MIKIDSSDLNKFSIYLSKKSDGDTKKIQKVLKNAGMNIEAEAKDNLTSNNSVNTGHLRRSIGNFRRGMTVTVHTSNVKYAVIVEKGSKAHVIRPKNKKALYWEGAKRPVKLVNHPGSRAKPFLIPAFESEKDKFIENLKEAIEW
jgi:HK97 gp10 family phage protein